MLKIGIYVDHENLHISGGSTIDFAILLQYISKGYYLQRANIYMPIHDAHSETLKERLFRFRDKLRSIGYRVVEKKVRKIFDTNTNTTVFKANMDMELAIDALRQSDGLDVVVLVTGDGDFVRLVEALQAKGKRIKMLAFKDYARVLKNAVDEFINGNDIPHIFRNKDIPISN